MLRPHVATTYVAYDAATALALAAAHAPELVITDLAMPEMDGLELAQQLRRLPGLAGSYFLALTAFDPGKYGAATRTAGFQEHLVKPVTEEQLIKVLESLDAGHGGER